MRFFKDNDYELMNEEGIAVCREVHNLLKPIFERPEYVGHIRVLASIVHSEVNFMEACQILKNTMELKKKTCP